MAMNYLARAREIIRRAAEAEVIEAFTGAGLPCIDQGSIISKRSGIFAWPT